MIFNTALGICPNCHGRMREYLTQLPANAPLTHVVGMGLIFFHAFNDIIVCSSRVTSEHDHFLKITTGVLFRRALQTFCMLRVIYQTK